MPSTYLVGLHAYDDPADIAVIDAATGEPIEILDIVPLSPVQSYVVTVDAPVGTAIEHSMRPVDIHGVPGEWAPMVPDVTAVPEPGLSWALAAGLALLFALVRRRKT